VFDPASEKVVLEVDQPFANHNGGHIAFGPDDFLYIGLGDGGSGGDPQGHGQNTSTLLGSMLRIDVTVPEAETYRIPDGNPFADGLQGRPEIYAWGLRNPYRWSFDSFSGQLWAGDVGQDAFGEVSIVRNGENYGWNRLEGFNCFNAENCSSAGTQLPEAAYPHSAGQSITGGVVYRGSDIPGLRGQYLFADFISGRIWSISEDAGALSADDAALDTSFLISSFSNDSNGEVYLTSYAGGAGEGIYKLSAPEAASASDVDDVPEKLSDTGCVNMANPRLPADGTLSYKTSATFWSDGATKHRAAAMPNGTQFERDAEGNFLFPVGSVLIKHFELNNDIFETRLFMHHQTGWAGYSYQWNDARDEALLLQDSQDTLVQGQTWHFPSRDECMRCHTQAAAVTLGLETGQLNTQFTYPESQQVAGQLDTLEFIDWPTVKFSESDRERFIPDPFGTSATLEQRAKAYLHTNCAQCHRPGGPTGNSIDFRFGTALADMGICNVEPQDGNRGNPALRRFAPSSPENSDIWLRIQDSGSLRMPPIGSNLIDQAGADLVGDWITESAACP
jgi:uncharacterized repeat protein (TIGR03806 family)